MAGNVTRAYQVAAQPWIVNVTDSPLGEYLGDLAAGGGPETSDLKDTENPLLLWAAPLTNTLDAAGTTYVVSAEVYKRIQARRYVGSGSGTVDDTADPA